MATTELFDTGQEKKESTSARNDYYCCTAGLMHEVFLVPLLPSVSTPSLFFWENSAFAFRGGDRSSQLRFGSRAQKDRFHTRMQCLLSSLNKIQTRTRELPQNSYTSYSYNLSATSHTCSQSPLCFLVLRDATIRNSDGTFKVVAVSRTCDTTI